MFSRLRRRLSKPRDKFDISELAMTNAIRDIGSDLASGKYRHVDAVSHVHHRDDPCHFNMDWYANSLLGMVERKLRLPRYGLVDLMRDMPPTSFNESLWELFYPHLLPSEFGKITPTQAAVAIDRWLDDKPPWPSDHPEYLVHDDGGLRRPE